jgi:hypothetical protein
MTKSSLAAMAFVSTLAAVAAGCSHQPRQTPAPVSAELNVMQVASDMGYNTPKVIDGKTYYCQREELTGSLVPKVACISSDEVVARARAQGDLLNTLAAPPKDFKAVPGGG